MKHNRVFFLWMVLCLVICSGCPRNTVSYTEDKVRCPEDYTFLAARVPVWEALVGVLAERGKIDIHDAKLGFILTLPMTFLGSDMEQFTPELAGRQLEYTYDIRLAVDGEQATRVSARVKLKFEQFAQLAGTDWHMRQVENYLREKLFTEVCRRLFPDGKGHCSEGFVGQPVITVVPFTSPVAQEKPKAQFDQQVQTAQTILARAGYSPGKADGVMGKKTREALKAFQQDNGLTVTGKVNDATFKLLQGGNWRPATVASDAAGESPAPVPEAIVAGTPVVAPDGGAVSSAKKETADMPQDAAGKQGGASASAPESGGKKLDGKFVTRDTAYLLKEPDMYGSDILETIPAGTVLSVLSPGGEYHKVKYKGKEGYVAAQFVGEQ